MQEQQLKKDKMPEHVQSDVVGQKTFAFDGRDAGESLAILMTSSLE